MISRALPIGLLVTALSVRAEELPSGLTLVDPLGHGTAEWVLPAGHGDGCAVVVDPLGHPWLGCRARFLIGPAAAELLEADTPFDSLAWLANGALFGSKGSEVVAYGFDAAQKAAKSVARLPSRVVARFPAGTARLYRGENVAYVVSQAPGRAEVVLFELGEQGWAQRVLFRTPRQITAVAGNGKQTFVALGRRILALTPRKDGSFDAEVVFDHPRAEVTGLGFESGHGLFYSTPESAGYVGSRYTAEFLRAVDAQFLWSNGSLYVLPAGGGALRVGGLERFAQRDEELARAGAPPELHVQHDGSADAGVSSTPAVPAATGPQLTVDLGASSALWSAAARAAGDEERATLVRASVDALLGLASDVALPASARGLPLAAASTQRVQQARTQFLAASTARQAAAGAAASIEDELSLAQKVLASAENNSELGQQANKLTAQLEKALAQMRVQRDEAQVRVAAAVASAVAELQPRSPHLRGLAEGVACLAERPAATCSGQSACEKDYRRGYSAGRRFLAARLSEAFRSGDEARRTQRPASGSARPDALGPCGMDWVDAFNAGYRASP
jgi:hypothetical protein